jgi:hypothetical protein
MRQRTGVTRAHHINVHQAEVHDPAIHDIAEQALVVYACHAQVSDRVVVSVECAIEDPNGGAGQRHSRQIDVGGQHKVLSRQVRVQTDGDELVGGGDLVGVVRLAGAAIEFDSRGRAA